MEDEIKKMDDVKKLYEKIYANCYWPATGTNIFYYPNDKIIDAMTKRGKERIKALKKEIKRLGFMLIVNEK